MIITPNGTIHFLTVGDHLQYKTVVYQDPDFSIRLTSNKKMPFAITDDDSEITYIDLFALRFGHKEELKRRLSTGWIPIQYGCNRSIRDEILLLPIDELINMFAEHNCTHRECQYWSHPTGVKSRYAMNCILARYMTMSALDLKSGLTLEEVSRIYGCTRERIRQIEEKAMRRMRHRSRLDRFVIFRERMFDYQDYFSTPLKEIA